MRASTPLVAWRWRGIGPGAGRLVNRRSRRNQRRHARVAVVLRHLPIYWEADHIVPVVEGGGLCGLDGYRTLCTNCHKAATRALARRRAAARRSE